MSRMMRPAGLRAAIMCALFCALAPQGIAHAAITLGHANTSALSSGLVGYWPLDGATTNWKTGTTLDMSGQGNNGALFGLSTSSTPAAGKIGQGFKFARTTVVAALQYVKVPDSSSLDIAASDSFTIDFWVKPSVVCDGINNQNYIEKAQDSVTPGWAIYMATTCILQARLVYTGARVDVNLSLANTAANFATSTWTQATLVGDRSTNLAQWYLNGKAVGSATNISALGDMSNANGLEIGSGIHGLGVNTVGGVMDDVRVYKRALSATEVALLYASGKANVGVVATNALSSGLVGHWTMDGKDIGTSFIDSSGNGFNGYLVGTNNATSSRKTIGKIGQAFSFGGQNTGAVDLGSSSTLNPTRFTISAWINLNKPQTWGYNYIFGSARDCNCSGTTYNGLGFSYGSGFLRGYIDNSTVYGVNAAVSIATSTWNHVAFSYDGSNMRLFLNGTVVKTQAHSIDPGSPATFDAYIGSMGNGIGNGGNYFTLDGKLDDVRIYNRALSDVEIAQLAAQGGVSIGRSNTAAQSGINAGLVGYWTFDGKNMNWKTGKALDSSGGGNDGALNGLGTTTSPTIGKIGQALRFDGTNSYISVSNAALSLSTGTLVAWVKTTNAGSSFRGIYTQANAAGIYLYNNAFATYDNGTASTRTTGVLLNDGKWHQVVMSFESGVTNGTLLYIDGSLSLTTTITNTSSGVVAIGQGQGGASQRFNGTIEDVRAYNRVLSASEVLQLYTASK